MTLSAILTCLLRTVRLYSDPVCINNVLPREVLGLVFDFLQLDELLLVSQICTDRRTAAIGTPRLWAQLAKAPLVALPTLMARAKAVPISLEILCITPMNLARVCDLITPYLAKVKDLGLHFDSNISDYRAYDWSPLWAVLRHVMPRLHSLKLTRGNGGFLVLLPADIVADSAHSLLRLRLMGFAVVSSWLEERSGTARAPTLRLDARFPALRELELYNAELLPLLSPAHSLRVLVVHIVGAACVDVGGGLIDTLL